LRRRNQPDQSGDHTNDDQEHDAAHLHEYPPAFGEMTD
jgi:hypothetical protein